MSKKENKEILEVEEGKELDLEDMEQVTGGGLRDVYYEHTKDIDEDIKERI